MPLINLNMYSEALDTQTSVVVVMPQVKTADNEKFKCLYLLHGLRGDQSIWTRKTSIERYAEKYGICVVMPNGSKSFYADMKYGMKFYTYIAKELPEIIENMFQVSKKREDRYIGGISMGGYGAMKIALKETGKYKAVFALSPVSDIHNPLFTETLVPVFGETIPESDDLFWLASEHETDDRKPGIYMTIGREDFMYEDSIRLKNHFENLEYDYKYVETAGSHTWDLWDASVQEALDWLMHEK